MHKWSEYRGKIKKKEEQKKVKEKKKRKEGKEKRRMKVKEIEILYIRVGVVSLILKRTSYRFERVDTLFWKQKRKKEKGVGGLAVNPTGTKVVCLSRFLLHLSLPLMFATSF